MTRPGGLLAVSEFDEPLRFLPEDLGAGRPGFESRTLEVLSTLHAEALPNIGASWAAMLDEAGWTVVDQHDVVIDERPPHHPLAGRYARAWFARLAGGLDGRLDVDDERMLEALLDDGAGVAAPQRPARARHTFADARPRLTRRVPVARPGISVVAGRPGGRHAPRDEVLQGRGPGAGPRAAGSASARARRRRSPARRPPPRRPAQRRRQPTMLRTRTASHDEWVPLGARGRPRT